ncbi:MAG: hypothetical protein ACQKBY_02325 [Verrucomicrobiales bacterium]
MRFSYPSPPDVASENARMGATATYYLELVPEEKKVHWTYDLSLPEGMHWKKGDEMGLGATHHEETQSFSQFLDKPFRELPAELDFVRKYIRKQVVDPEPAPALRYDGFPFGGDKIHYKTDHSAKGHAISYYLTPKPDEALVTWHFFPHLPEGLCAKKGDESGLGSMHSNGWQSYADFLEKPLDELPAPILARVIKLMSAPPSAP